MSERLMPSRRWHAFAVAGAWEAASVVLSVLTWRVKLGVTGGIRPRLAWPWVHWCMFDEQCRHTGVPRRIYVFGFYLEIR